MATFIESDVDTRLVIVRRNGQVRIEAQARSVTAEGLPVRTLRKDITDQLSQARIDGAAALLDDVEARVRQLWGIS